MFNLPDLTQITQSPNLASRFGLTIVAILAIIAVMVALRSLLIRRFHRTRERYWLRKISNYFSVTFIIVAIAIIWAPFSKDLSLVLGFLTAGIAIASQDILGSFFAWMNILSGHIYAVGDRIMIGNVKGVVLDITPLRTKLLEINMQEEELKKGWIGGGRQYSGRIISISNRKIFTEEVFNYSSYFNFVWDEFVVILSHKAEWEKAIKIVEAEVRRHTAEMAELGRLELRELSGQFLIDDLDAEPRTFVSVSPYGIKLATRYITKLMGTRRVRDNITRSILIELRKAGIEIAVPTQSIQIEQPTSE